MDGFVNAARATMTEEQPAKSGHVTVTWCHAAYVPHAPVDSLKVIMSRNVAMLSEPPLNRQNKNKNKICICYILIVHEYDCQVSDCQCAQSIHLSAVHLSAVHCQLCACQLRYFTHVLGYDRYGDRACHFSDEIIVTRFLRALHLVPDQSITQ